MSVVRVTIQPSVLRWALKRTGLTNDELQKVFPKVLEWTEGNSAPTLKQAQELAKRARVPFGRLLLKEPTGEDVGVADFRTVKNIGLEDISPDLQEVISSAQSRLAWYSEYALDVGIEAPRLLGIVGESDSTAVAASKVRELLDLELSKPLSGPDKVRTLVVKMEDAGILVSRNSIVGSSTQRRLNVNEFRGFTLTEDEYCLVFINTRDAKTAQLFSLAHELGHVVLGRPGISDHSDQLQVERWCNRFAAEFLAPPSAVKEWFDPEESILTSVENLAKRFGMSREAILWRLVELQFITRESASQAVAMINQNKYDEETKKDIDGAPPRHILVRSRVGNRFFETVAHAAETGYLPDREAARYLGAATYQSFEKLLQSRRRPRREVV